GRVQRVRDGLRPAERALEERLVGRDGEGRIELVSRADEAGQHDQYGTDQQAEQDRDPGDEQLSPQRARATEECGRVDVHPGRAGVRGLGHAGTSALPVAMIRPTRSFSAVSASRIATRRPRYMTPIRSDNSMISSSSAETSRTAVPASRLATICLWMNSMEPTSIPRVGWSATSSLSSRLNS